ncbi:Gcv operon activator [Thalassovita gelatinovora]|uniref:Gcv operon activator n=1 Tax=Thalassovita gelatinovora TaxID=53501 RepID=A0A0P1F8X1_THAGE|nr:LysR family transcriptional regulator [Thalassovita gelatinovora]QIZ81335.1 LysR family transcriptional regulator [Thalassovita gelatinovora]CUH64485.1 Gcv operon activator [Thalassovita gelatinovora]SEP97697.1 DNA-binding transcriptional regulator, LysR family [Thalassovita gelatinovora]
MIAPRRFLPSINSLLALEAVDRLGTATAAAQELALTHSAVSRQLKVLEEQIGVSMFVRDGKVLRLTPAGEAYAYSVRNLLQNLARASLKLKATGGRRSLNIAILPAFGMHWLTPRLRAFTKLYPDIQINQSTRLTQLDFERENFDAALHFGTEDWIGVNYLPLASERVIAVCAPDFTDHLPLPPERLRDLPLLHLDSRPGAWEAWFASHGFEADQLRGMLFDQFTTLAEAAALGFGVALLPEFLARTELSRGRLVPASSGYIDVEGTYYLVWPKSSDTSDALTKLIDWIQQSL